ncbi:MAG: putative lipopolysaccharide heptosyltransferase III [Gammaproteobacteria bacterium]
MEFPGDKILLVAMPLIGDALLATPLLRSLRRARPQATIDALVYHGHETILEGNPDLTDVLTVSPRPRFAEYRAIVRRIFRRYDLAISISDSDRKMAYAVLAGRKRISIVPPPRWQDAWKRYMTHAWTEYDKDTHTVLQNLRLADLIGVERCYELVAPRSEMAGQTLDRLLPFAWREQDFAVLHPAPRWVYKRWTADGWEQLARHLAAKGLPIVLSRGGDAEEVDYVNALSANMPDAVVDLEHTLSFSEVATLISRCRVFIGADTAVTHIAAATGAPTIALFGPTRPTLWAPWPVDYAQDKPPFANKGTQRINNVTLVQGSGHCVPCGNEGCDRHKQSRSRCLEELHSAAVIQAVDATLNCVVPIRAVQSVNWTMRD